MHDPVASSVDPYAIVMLGVDHLAAPLVLRERIAAAVADLPRVLGHLREHAGEAAVLSTCNRTEIYLVGADLSHGTRCLARVTGCLEDDLVSWLSARRGRDAVEHLFAVAAGVESQLLGESQILGQVRDAYQRCRDAGGTGPLLAGLFRHALAVGKRARAQTDISRGAASIGSAAVAIVRREFGHVGPRHLVVVGAGAAAERVLAHLRTLRDARVDIANRSVDRAAALVAPPGRPLSLDALPAELGNADAVICATSAPHPILTLETMRSVPRDPGHRLLVLDLAVPRDVEPAIGSLPDIDLYDVDAIQSLAASTVDRRTGEVGRVRHLIDQELVAFERWLGARRAASQIVALREQAETLRREEIARLAGRLGPSELAAVERATRAVLRSLLHGPTVALRGVDDPAIGSALAAAFRRTRRRDSAARERRSPGDAESTGGRQ